MIAMVTTSEWGFESAETIVNQDILIFWKNLKSFVFLVNFSNFRLEGMTDFWICAKKLQLLHL